MGLGTETAGIPERQNFPASSGLRHPPASRLVMEATCSQQALSGQIGCGPRCQVNAVLMIFIFQGQTPLPVCSQSPSVPRNEKQA